MHFNVTVHAAAQRSGNGALGRYSTWWVNDGHVEDCFHVGFVEAWEHAPSVDRL